LFFYLRNNQHGKLVAGLSTVFCTPQGVIPVIGLFVAEVLVMKPRPYELFAATRHGAVLGALAFFVGFCFALCGHSFSSMLLKWRWLFLVLASGLFVIRSVVLGANTPGYLLPVETNCWILSVLAFGYRYLNHPGKALSYLSQAAYPVYILHLMFLFLGSSLVFPLPLSAPLKFVVVLAFTVAGCFAAFELIRRVSILRPLFGLKMTERSRTIREDNQGLAQA
jgi:glucan biosynthesis protein C